MKLAIPESTSKSILEILSSYYSLVWLSIAYFKIIESETTASVYARIATLAHYSNFRKTSSAFNLIAFNF